MLWFFKPKVGSLSLMWKKMRESFDLNIKKMSIVSAHLMIGWLCNIEMTNVLPKIEKIYIFVYKHKTFDEMKDGFDKIDITITSFQDS